jgi:hypothetical protein
MSNHMQKIMWMAVLMVMLIVDISTVRWRKLHTGGGSPDKLCVSKQSNNIAKQVTISELTAATPN